MTKAMLALSTVLGIGTATVGTADSSSYGYLPTKISVNGKQISTPKHITAPDPFAGANASKTAFLPIYYIDGALKDLGITANWDGHTMSLSVPSSIKVNYPSPPKALPLSSSVMAIEINGKIVTYAPKITYNDAGTTTATTFVPVFYLEKTFGYLGFNTSWDGTTWAVTGSTTGQTGQTYPDGWTAPVLTESWSPELSAHYEAGEFKLFQDELGFGDNGHWYSIPGQKYAITIGDSGVAGHGAEVQISFTMWGPDKYDPNWEPGVPDAYRIPVIAEQLFKFYFGNDWKTVWDYYNNNNIPDKFTANGRTCYSSYASATGQVILDVGYPASK